MVLAIIAASHALASRTNDARTAIEHLRQLDPGLRVTNPADWLSIQRPEHMTIFAEGLRQVGLPA